MPYTPTTGLVAILQVGTTTIPGTNWTLNYDPKLANASNFRDGRVKVSTLPDGQVTLTLIYSLETPPTLTSGLNLRAGATGTAKLYVDASNYYSFPFVVGPISPKNNGLEDLLRFDCTLEYSGAGFAYPANG